MQSRRLSGLLGLYHRVDEGAGGAPLAGSSVDARLSVEEPCADETPPDTRYVEQGLESRGNVAGVPLILETNKRWTFFLT